MKKINKTLLTVGLSFGLSATALAGPIYSFNIDTPPGSDKAGDIKNVSTSYNTNTEVFSWSHTIGKNAMGDLSDGFWLVVTDGENPKNDANEYAILYGDVNTGTVTAYEYSGARKDNSYNDPNILLGSYSGLNSIDNADMTRTISFSLDATDINANNGVQSVSKPNMWKGLNFSEKVGIWFHPLTATNINYDSNNGITSLSYSKKGWYDTSNRSTTTVAVSEPQTVLLFAIGMLGLGVSRRFRCA